VPSGVQGQKLALLYQLERTQWLPPERLRELQQAQLAGLLRHAYATVPFYRERWRAAPRPEALADLPVLARREVQQHSAELRSEAVPAAHGATKEAGSSGSTGTPVRVLKTGLLQLLWDAFTLREHHWHRRDPAAKLAAIRFSERRGRRRGRSWGSATAGLFATGPAVGLGIDTDPAEQLAWLEEERPAYLLTYPTLAAELARRSLARGVRLPGLREVRTFSELLDPEVRALCREAWGVKVTDVYSSVETGYLALQCPEAEHYHVQSEGVLLEVLDEAGAPCRAGETGRVVVTVLHNFAMPLVRYELGDFAEVGEACGCGRSLPVLRRILGRQRNMLVTLSGKRYWPSFGAESVRRIAPVIQYQCVQKARGLLEARLVVSAPVTPEQEQGLKAHFASRVPEGASVTLTYCERLPRGAGGKFDEFLSEVR
jgi:phenylacetate-CoA ligase